MYICKCYKANAHIYAQMDTEDGLQMVVLVSTAVIAQIMQALNMSLVCVTISPTLQFYWYIIYFTIQYLYHISCVLIIVVLFIIFQDVSPTFGSTMTPDQPVDLFLDAVSYIGVILSIFGLLLTFISYIMTKLVVTITRNLSLLLM